MKHDDPMREMLYQIQVQGNLDDSWSAWIGTMTIQVKGDISILTGYVADQAALRGLLCQLWDLNLKLISVRLIEAAAKQED